MAASRNRCPLLAATGAKNMGWDTLTGTMGRMRKMGIIMNQDDGLAFQSEPGNKLS